jgi:hypothetical protein
MKWLFVLAIAAVLLSGCNESTSPGTGAPAEVHTINVNNLTIYAAKQLVRLELTPAAGGETIVKTFVCNYGTELPVAMAIPAAGSYRIEVFSADSQSMWWDSVALDLPGTTTLRVTCGSSPIIFWGECASLPPSGTTMTP